MTRSRSARKRTHESEETRAGLIEAAEFLFAHHGIEGVSLRQIGVAAGSLNTNVVGYHFGNKEALIEAIYHHRLPAMDARRRELLDAADRIGLGQDCKTLLTVMWLPLFEQKSVQNQHTYTRFLASISRDGLGYTRQALDPLYPATNEVAERLRAFTGRGDTILDDVRMRMQAFMIYGALEYIDQTCPDDEKASRQIFEETVSMGALALGS